MSEKLPREVMDGWVQGLERYLWDKVCVDKDLPRESIIAGFMSSGSRLERLYNAVTVMKLE